MLSIPQRRFDMRPDTNIQFKEALAGCRDLFARKLTDYGASWRILRPASLTDQIFIKAKRIRSLETKGRHLIEDGVLPEFIAIVNYGIIGLIQLDKGYADTTDIGNEEAMRLYDRWSDASFGLMVKKNHDYDEAWRGMRVNSYTDFILTKIERIKEIENNSGHTSVSEGIDSNYMDIINYAVFGIIKLTQSENEA